MHRPNFAPGNFQWSLPPLFLFCLFPDESAGEPNNRLYTPAFGSIYTVYPPQAEQDAIVDYLDKIKMEYQSVIGKIEDEIEILHEMKDKLVSDAVTGKIDVRDIEVPDYEYVDEDNDDIEDDSENIDGESNDEEV